MTEARILFSGAARARILDGADALARAVKVTLGPRGRNVLLESAHGPPKIISDGSSVAECFELSDSFANVGARLLREAALETGAATGDGTAIATVLAHAILRGGMRAIAAELEAPGIKRGIALAVEAAVRRIQALSRPVASNAQIAQVATIAANGDPEIGDLIARAMAAVGRDGLILAEAGRARDDRLEIVMGMSFDRGYVSRFFVTDEASSSVELRNPCILIYEKKISRLDPLLPMLDRAVELKRPLLIVAEDVENEALTTLVVNRQRGGLKVAAVKAPGFAGRRRESLEDLAVLTGGTLILGEPGMDLADATPMMLGQAEKVRITHNRTDIVGGAGDPDAVRRRCDQLRRLRAGAKSAHERELLGRRLGRLAGGIAVIKAGGFSEAEILERRCRIEKALRAARAAADEGLVPGGGVALLHAAGALGRMTADSRAEQAGIAIVKRALEAPVFEIARNSGADGAAVVGRIVANKDAWYGFDAAALEFGDMSERGIVDPLPMVRTALRRAASVAGLLFTIEAVVGVKPKVKVRRHPVACKFSDQDHHHYPGDPYHEHHH